MRKIPTTKVIGKRDSIHHHLLEAVSETANVLESRQKLLYTTPSGWWWRCIEPVFPVTEEWVAEGARGESKRPRNREAEGWRESGREGERRHLVWYMSVPIHPDLASDIYTRCHAYYMLYVTLVICYNV